MELVHLNSSLKDHTIRRPICGNDTQSQIEASIIFQHQYVHSQWVKVFVEPAP